MAKKMVCPNGCNANFITTAHVVQEWKVDNEGNFIEALHDCIEVAHRPDTDNIWSCAKCRAEGHLENMADDTGSESELRNQTSIEIRTKTERCGS